MSERQYTKDRMREAITHTFVCLFLALLLAGNQFGWAVAAFIAAIFGAAVGSVIVVAEWVRSW